MTKQIMLDINHRGS
jgi:hypothetical protein